MTRKKVLFVRVHNSARSQMAEAFLDDAGHEPSNRPTERGGSCNSPGRVAWAHAAIGVARLLL